VLIWGAMDERSFIHSVNESVELSEVERIALAEALFIRNLGEGIDGPGARLEE